MLLKVLVIKLNSLVSELGNLGLQLLLLWFVRESGAAFAEKTVAFMIPYDHVTRKRDP